MKTLGLLVALGLAASAHAQIVFSYALESDQNIVPVLSGGVIRFPGSPAGVDAGAEFQMTNRSDSPSAISGIGVTGAAFRLSGTPLFPAVIGPGQTLRIRVVYRATGVGVLDLGQLTVTIAGVGDATFSLEGTGRPTSVTVAYALASDQNVIPVAPGGAIDFGDAGGATAVEAALLIVNTGTFPALVASISATGAAFRLTGVPLLPALLAPGQTLRVTLTYRPSGAATDSGSLRIGFAGETLAPFNLIGRDSAAALSLQYRAGNGNAIPVAPGGTIEFPATLVGATATATLQIRNVGTQDAVFTGIATSGAAFGVSGLPPLPFVLPAGQSFEVQVVYSAVSALDLGVLTLALPSRAVTIHLAGRRVVSSLSYFAETEPPVTLTTGGTLTFPDTNLGAARTVNLRVTNSGPAVVRLTQIAVSGEGFSLEGLPALPLNLAAGEGVTVRLLFRAVRAGNATGTLSVNEDRVFLRALVIGPAFTFRYESAGVTADISELNPAVVFPAVEVSASALVTFIIRNAGTGAGAISGLGISGGSGVFAFDPAPALPVTLQPGEELSIGLRFTPANPGAASASLQINSQTIALSGVGTEPPPVPRYTLSGPSGAVAPASQSRIELTLERPYPATIAGTLTLDVGGTLPPDPAVQFATGGRTVAFEIPANTTRAIFPGRVPQVGIQTGTVASAMRVTAAFRTQAGGVELRDASPASLEFSIAAAAPVIQLMEASNVSSTSFRLILSGFTTTRELTSLVLRFTPTSGASMANAEVRVDLRPASSLWFQRQASQAFGGQFTLTLPLNFSGGQDPVSRLAAVTATVENAAGASSPFEIRLR